MRYVSRIANQDRGDKQRKNEALSCAENGYRNVKMLGIRSSALFAIAAARRFPFLYSGDVESSDRHAGIIIEPNDNATALRVKTSVIRAGNRIPPPAASNNGERFKWSRF